MGRKSIGGMLTDTIDNTEPPATTDPTASSAPPPAAAPTPAGEGDASPTFREYTRKEARLTEEQLDQLTAITRRLNRARNSQGHRITDNTLIRIAVDLLLQNADQLTGTTEHELRKSLSL